jgi:hypothetical protein
MGFKDKAAEANRQIESIVSPHLHGETATGFGFATRRKSAFKSEMTLFGVSPSRIVFVAADRQMRPLGEVIELTPADIVKSSIDGLGAGVGHFLGNSDGEVWIDTAQHGRLKLMMIGDGILERSMLGTEGVSGTRALCEWLDATRAQRS